ncbi:hypothetical protein [Microbacterium sp. UFMG61]|uniref:hypothetical protein n=1 Tax=Microbacterium sp. UFMG61 TaxID=2745935 RepID=UPI002B267CB9|nr:hypothetical protein [Microbacterium sp. UFMG61]
MAASSRDIRSTASLHVEGDAYVPTVSHQSTLAEAIVHPTVGPALRAILDEEAPSGFLAMGDADRIVAIMGDFPLVRFARIAGGALRPEVLDAIIESYRAE